MFRLRTHALPIFALATFALLSGGRFRLSAQQDAREAARSAGVTVASTADLKAQLLRRNGRIHITVLYGTQCPISQSMFRDLGILSRRFSSRGVDFFAYSTDREAENISSIPMFMRKYAAHLDSRWLEPWSAGQLIDAVGSVGVPLESSWTLPLVIVQDTTGTVVWGGEAIGSLPGLDEWLAQALRKE